jgi:DNA-binding response OmpR family regulator
MAKKVLVIDDDPNIVDYIVSVLTDNGYETCTASTGQSGFEMVKTEKPDLITLDLDMPEGWGTTLYRMLQRSEGLKDIPIIVISGLEERPAAIEALTHYLGKPFDRNEFLRIVKNLTD